MQTGSSPIVCYPGDVGETIHETQLFVERFVFANYSDPSHRCILRDSAGRIALDVRGSNEMVHVEVAPGQLPFTGLTLDSLPSGQLQIYYM